MIRHPQQVFLDLIDHQRGVGFFTAVAGTSVLGSQLLIVTGSGRFAFVLWIATVGLWALLVYAVFAALTVKEIKPPLDQGIYTFFRFSPSDLLPPYWINMGAMAISTLAGTLLMASRDSSSLLRSLDSFILGLTILFWATATLWIPMLVILGFWRHVYKRFPLTYSPLYWGAVFPLGMYAVCSHRLAQVTGMDMLTIIPHVFAPIALAAWSVTFFGLVRALGRQWRRS